MPRSTSQESSGERIAPEPFWTKESHSTCSGFAATAMPPTESEWPFKNFVVEWTTRSAPMASGFCRYGDANVLSTTTSAPRSWAISERSAMSQIVIVGFVGDSRCRRRVLSRNARRVILRVGGVHEGEVDAVAGQDLRVVAVRPAVGHVGADDVLSRLDERRDGGDGRHARTRTPEPRRPPRAPPCSPRAPRASGFCVRAYSYPLCLPSASCTYVEVW